MRHFGTSGTGGLNTKSFGHMAQFLRRCKFSLSKFYDIEFLSIILGHLFIELTLSAGSSNFVSLFFLAPQPSSILTTSNKVLQYYVTASRVLCGNLSRINQKLTFLNRVFFVLKIFKYLLRMY